ncbi:MAG: rod shape-determining protein RodA [Candidatus Niyogibacteria bacterium]|nr:rod shape-determining protein RodA [Candidatus Niyogibacteria bacterium]
MRALLGRIDWILFASLVPLLFAGLITMKSFGGGDDYFFWRQLAWIAASVAVFFGLSWSDPALLRSRSTLIGMYGAGLAALFLLFMTADPIRGASSWFRIGALSLEPVEPMKIILALILAKYFSRRHIEIANIRHIIVSGLYVLLPLILVFIQPDLGSALILIALWLATVLASGISKKHFFALGILAVAVAVIGWFFVLEPYQRTRIYSFLDPYLDPRGGGYHTIQAQIAVGAGSFWGRGIGYGSQSRLEFLPEPETDFMFAAFAEEWGFVGSFLLLIFFGIAVWRILRVGVMGEGNFERLFAIGFASTIIAQFFIHVGMNVGLLPITGLPLPFVSYGGSSLITLFAGLGILNSLSKRPLYERE